MNTRRKPLAHECEQPSSAHQSKLQQPGAKQPKKPPIYHPAKQSNAASKAEVSQRTIQRKRVPAAPPIYNPSLPKVLQRKTAGNQSAVTSNRAPVAPPVYRPNPRQVVQPKSIKPSDLRRPPAAPPVYRPGSKTTAQPKTGATAKSPKGTPTKSAASPLPIPSSARSQSSAVVQRQANTSERKPKRNVIELLTPVPGLQPNLRLTRAVIQRRNLTPSGGIAFGRDAGGLTLGEWQQLADAVGERRDANVVRFARIPNWNFNGKRALATAFAANNGRRTAAQWITIASRLPANSHAEATVFARIPNWTTAAVANLAQAFNATPGRRSADEWAVLATHVANNQHATVAEFAQINWSAANVNTLADSHRNNLVNGLSAANLAALANVIPDNNQAPTAAVTLSAINNVNNYLALITELYTRDQPNATGIAQIINAGAINGYSANQRLTLIRDHLQGLSQQALINRLTVHGIPATGPGGVNAVFTGMTQDITSLNQTLNQRNVSQARQNDIRTAFRARNWRVRDLQDYLRDVANLLNNNRPMENPAHWLKIFALEHTQPLALANASLQRAVGANPNRINVRGWIVNHVCNRHTFKHFDFGNIAANNTFFDPGQNEASIRNELIRIASHNDVTGRRANWDNGAAIQCGAYQVRIQPDPAVGGDYRYSQFFFVVGNGHRIAQAPLQAMRTRGLF